MLKLKLKLKLIDLQFVAKSDWGIWYGPHDDQVSFDEKNSIQNVVVQIKYRSCKFYNEKIDAKILENGQQFKK